MYKNLNTYALRLLKQKQYSVNNLRDKLLRKFPDMLQDVDTLIENYIETNLLDDQRLSESISYSLAKRAYGPLKLKQKLIMRQLTFSSELQNLHSSLAKTELQKKLLHSFPILLNPDKLEVGEKFRIQQWIYRRGFKYSLNDVLSWSENENEQPNP